jgi:hypothetical protein
MASNNDDRRKWGIFGGGFLAIIVLALLIWSRLPPPQLQADEQVFNTVDALFTALTARDLARLDDCERRLKAYHEEGKTSRAVATRLDAIVKQAHDGHWEPAARKLYDFMLAQRG